MRDDAWRGLEMARIGLIFILLFLFITVGSAYQGVYDGINISVNKTGDNFILWRWDFNATDSGSLLTKTIFINGNKTVDNGTLTYYLLSGINPDERQIIEIWGYNKTLNTLNTTAKLVSKTYEQNVWYPLMIGSGIVVVGWFTAPIFIMISPLLFAWGFQMARDMTTQSYIMYAYGFAFIISMAAFVIRIEKRW